jgi:integrase
MVRGGISLPALMQLMGHADIQTTLRYYAQTVDMCSGGAKLPITSARALPDSA